MTDLQCLMVENVVLVQLLREGYAVSENVQVLVFSAARSIVELTTCCTVESTSANLLPKLKDILKTMLFLCVKQKLSLTDHEYFLLLAQVSNLAKM